MRGAESRGIDMAQYPNVKRMVRTPSMDGLRYSAACRCWRNRNPPTALDDKARDVMFARRNSSGAKMQEKRAS